ncbi:cbb3-type cytochrome oxidase assembly protein CcoS [Blattabacterium cuenoti]|uniref:cbb3-type cytochrome oxidase assembly protein CcoS n=1 Tax=Blattabacterium cuenoti TaxID=1653831 RepID=UPI00163C31F6|nr:cbb3-type cytochrome oxidase assembly protein CcoS [Blattabacterium cuenoti]
MDIIIIMILSSVSVGILFLIFFLCSIYYGQFDDYETPKFRILMDDYKIKSKNKNNLFHDKNKK